MSKMNFESMSIQKLIELSSLIDNGIKEYGENATEYPKDNIGSMALSIVGLFINPSTEKKAIDLINTINYLIVLKNEASRNIFVEKDFMNNLKSESNDTPRFVIYSTIKGFMFVIISIKSEVLAVSSTYTRIQSCYQGIRSVKANSSAPIEDLFGDIQPQVLPYPKYEIYQDKSNEYRFRLYAKNGEPILTSEGYAEKSLCMNAIKKIKDYSDIAIIERA